MSKNAYINICILLSNVNIILNSVKIKFYIRDSRIITKYNLIPSLLNLYISNIHIAQKNIHIKYYICIKNQGLRPNSHLRNTHQLIQNLN